MINLLPLPNRKPTIISCLWLCGLLLLLLGGCAAQQSDLPMRYRWASIEGGQLQEAVAGEQFPFTIPVDEGMIAAGAPVAIEVSGDVARGWLRFELRGPDGQAAWNSGTINPGEFAISADYILPAGQTGTYALGMVYAADTQAVYNLGWQAIRLGPLLLLPGLGMIAVGVVFILYAWRKKLLGWRYLGLGALFFVLSVAVKFAVAALLNPPVLRMLGASQETLFAPGNLAAYLYIGALTGIFEVGLVWLVLSKVRWGRATWDQALAFGIGFGAVEALLLGLASLGSALTALLGPDTLPISVLGALASNATPGMGLAPAVERLAVILVHIFTCLLIFYAIASGQSRWGWLAILVKTALDAVAGFAAFWGADTLGKVWTLEAIILAFGLAALWGTRQIVRRYRQLPSGAVLTADTEAMTV